ncbi:hypothetical protein PVA45_01585 [Entomospira entomophila]|uniref:Uncharacterized protein n=1 Tax=Entomospira entomophila TaxID=2719988 RepID=A0A968GD16_9SPIO|nr:hypothetical protein [Entomospira entomophilus]NIZ40204.1 hypothetical protein [Entomospira entomophilus]WDI35763.1 hypothetical protein PVA45_01585 [Entomospira entomophilus]
MTKKLLIPFIMLFLILIFLLYTSSQSTVSDTLTPSGYLVYARNHLLNLKSNQEQQLTLSHYGEGQWTVLSPYTTNIDTKESRYYFQFKQFNNVSVDNHLPDSSDGISVTRYDLHTGKQEHLTLNTHFARISNAKIYPLSQDQLLLQHTYEDSTILELFSIAENRTLQHHLLSKADLLNTGIHLLNPITILYYDPEKEYLILNNLPYLHHLDLKTMQVTQLEGISAVFTSHQGSTLGSYHSSAKEHLLVTAKANNKDLKEIKTAIYHLPTMQIVQYLPDTLPDGDYYLVDKDLILIRKNYQTVADFLTNFFSLSFLIGGQSSSDKLYLYRIQDETATLLWHSSTVSNLGLNLDAHYLDHFETPLVDTTA